MAGGHHSWLAAIKITHIGMQQQSANSPDDCHLPITLVLLFGATVPLFGRTVYALGAVVLILNDNRFFEGLISFSSTETGSVNKPEADTARVIRQHKDYHT